MLDCPHFVFHNGKCKLLKTGCHGFHDTCLLRSGFSGTELSVVDTRRLAMEAMSRQGAAEKEIERLRARVEELERERAHRDLMEAIVICRKMRMDFKPADEKRRAWGRMIDEGAP